MPLYTSVVSNKRIPTIIPPMAEPNNEGIIVLQDIPTKEAVYVIPSKGFGSNIAAKTPTKQLEIIEPYHIS